MKKSYIHLALLMLGIIFSTFTAYGQGNYGKAVKGIPEDWENDLWLNTHYQELVIGDTYQLVARRVPEIIDNALSNKVVLPTFHYEVINGESVSVNESGLITANKLGTSIIKVTYDAKEVYGSTYGAVSPVNITYMAVDVIDKNIDTGIKLSTDIALRSYDTYYFTGNSTQYAFKVTAENADDITVKCNNVVAKKVNDKYVVNLQNRANIIEVVAKNTVGTKKLYYVIDGRTIEINIKNVTNPDKKFQAGDKVQVSFKGITLPVYKLATIYNPQMEMPTWGATATKVYYNNKEIGKVKTNVDVSQYDLATKNTIEFTLPKEKNYLFNDGHIYEYWWGSGLGTEKDMTGPGEPNLNAGTVEDRFSIFPNFNISVGYQPATFEDVEVGVLGYRYADASQVEIMENVQEELKSGSFIFKNTSTNWGAFTSWYGIAVSNQTDNVTPGGVANQFNSAAGGDITGKGNYGVIFDAYSVGGMGADDVISFTNKDYPEGQIVKGCYITNNTYATNSMMNGDSFAKKFGGTTGNDKDFFKLTIKGYNTAGDEVGTAEFYLGDYRFENNTKDYIVKDWRWLDLSSFGKVAKIIFSTSSSDVGDYGMNTPSYFCIDNINKPRLILQNALTDISVKKNASNYVIDLSNTFVDAENNSTENIGKEIVYNTNSDLVTASINDNQLTLAFATNKTGEAEINVKGTLEKMGAYSTFKIKVDNNTGVDNTETIKLLLTPNPTRNFFSLNSSGKVEIYNTSGVKVYENRNYTSNSQIQISNLANGIYFVRINNQTIKLIKQ